jgi:hypothetical protein
MEKAMAVVTVDLPRKGAIGSSADTAILQPSGEAVACKL